MSFDFQLAHACPHLTIEEEVVLGSDRRELRTRQPVASSTHIRITANDQVSIPPTGVFASAELSGSVSGPFKIVKNEQILAIRNRTQGTEVTLPIGTRLDTTRIVDVINAALLNASVRVTAENINGYLLLSDQSEEGPGSQIRVGGLAAPYLGFLQQVRARGRMVYPPWSYAEQPVIQTTANLNVIIVPARFPKFSQPVKGNPVFKVSYTTYQQHCRRCQSFGIENDYRINANGNALTVRNEDLLNQGALKILSTIKNSNPFHPDYGTTLITKIGTKALGNGSVTINEDVVTALNIFKRYQMAQGRYQEVTPRERLASILSVNTTPSEVDPTVFEVVIVATNASNVPVVITTVYAAPGTAALAGSNGLSLGLEGFGLDPRTRTIPGVAVR